MTTNTRLPDAALEALLARYAGRVSADGLQAGIMADVATTEQARRPILALPRWHARPAASGRLAAVPTVAWVLLLTGLLLGLVAGGLAGGLWRGPDREATILATTKAHPLPAQATCPPGSDPDAPGPADQDRPGGGAMAFDRHAGRTILLAPADGADAAADPEKRGASQTWTYDVCSNTWQRMHPVDEPDGGWGSPGPVRLVYDADSDRTLAFTDPDIWSYELVADRWTRVGSLPVAADGATNILYGTTFYHDPSGLVVHYDGLSMWAYDVDTGTFSEIRQRPDPAQPAGAGLPQGKIAFGYDPRHDLVVAVVAPFVEVSRKGVEARFVAPSTPAETWTFDPGTGAWGREDSPAASDLIVCGVWWTGSTDCFQTYGRSVFDDASSLTLFITRDYGQPAAPDRVDAYDAVRRAWRTLSPATGTGGAGPYWCASTPPVYDPLNGRIICEKDGQVSAFSAATGEWRWLFESPLSAAPPVP